MARMFKVQEVADYLCVHAETIRRMARRGDIPSFKVGRDWRISESALKRWEETHHLCSRKAHVLVVDDEEAFLQMIRQTIERHGYRVSTASSGSLALELIKRDPPDVVLLDLVMPEMDGPTILKEIRKFDEHLPMIIITGYPDSNLMMAALRQSPFMVLPKPVEAKKMIEVVDLSLNGSRSRRAFMERS